MTVAVPVLQYTQDRGTDGLSVLVVGDTHGSRFKARRSVDASGLRVLGVLTPEEALQRLEAAPLLSAMWIEFEDAPTLAGRRMLERADSAGRVGKLPIIVATKM